MSESASDAGPANMLRILVGARGAWASDTMEAAREVATDIPACDLMVFGLGDTFTDSVADRSSAPPRDDTETLFARLSVSVLAFTIATAASRFVVARASSDSLSPTHVRANHRPPPMPLISRLAVRQ